MTEHVSEYNDLKFIVNVRAKHNIGGNGLTIYGFSGFVLPLGGEPNGVDRLTIESLTEEGYRHADWALEAAIEEAQAIIDGKRPLKNPADLRPKE